MSLVMMRFWPRFLSTTFETTSQGFMFQAAVFVPIPVSLRHEHPNDRFVDIYNSVLIITSSLYLN